MNGISLDENLALIEKLRGLGRNWDAYNAEPFPDELIDRAKQIIEELDVQPDIYPSACGFIQMEYENSSEALYLEFEVGMDKIECYFEVDGLEEEFTLPPEDAAGQMNKMVNALFKSPEELRLKGVAKDD